MNVYPIWVYGPTHFGRKIEVDHNKKQKEKNYV